MEWWVVLAEDLFWLHVVIVFLYGALMGSFFNVCIYRLPLGQSPGRPRRSFCPSCGMMIAWYDNIPLYSYLRLRGLCRHCGVQFSSRYFWIELLTALLFVSVFWVHRYSLATILLLLLTSFLVISTFTDLDHWIIPDVISLGGALVGLLAAVGAAVFVVTSKHPEAGRSLLPYVATPFNEWGPWGIAANSLAGAVFGYALLWVIGVVGTLMFRKEAMGMGDMKLFACIGAFMGWHACLLVLAMASFIGATMGISLIMAQWLVEKMSLAREATEPQAETPSAGGDDANEMPAQSPKTDEAEAPAARQSRRLHHLPFGPYIAIAAYIVALFCGPIMKWLGRHLLLNGLA